MRVYEAMLDAFPSREALAQMVHFGLDLNLARIADGPNLGAVVQQLIEWAESQGCLEELVAVAKTINPGNPQLRGLDLSASKGLKTIPVLIVAMNHRQAEKLVTQLLRARGNRDSLGALKRALSHHHVSISEISGCYGDTPNAWQPYQLRPKTIHTFLRETVAKINERRAGTSESPYVDLRLLSTPFLAEDHKVRQGIAYSLEDQECILIADAISLFDSEVQQILTDSGIAFNRKASISVFSPIGARHLSLIQLIDEVLGRKFWQRPFWRFENEWDPHCEFGIGDPPALQRWLAAVLPAGDSLRRTMAIHPQAEQLLEEEVRISDSNPAPSGSYQQLLYGGGNLGLQGHTDNNGADG